MFRTHSRLIAAVVVCFFTWTSGGVFSIAHAAFESSKKSKARDPQQKKTNVPEEHFSKITEELEHVLADSKTDIGSKKAHLKASFDEITKLDGEMREQFAATEKKLRAAKLPAEILDRHHKFVKHYNDNLNELKNNISRVEKSKNNADAETALGKVHEHLKRVKAPSTHQKFDPNNLPHRQPLLKKREPRMKKEEFDRDLKKDKHAWKNQKRIQVASTGSLAGLLISSSINAIGPPTAADLAETIDVQLTSEIKAKALELEYKPVKIYEWVRNNIEFVPTWGSIQGAQMTMHTRQGNAFDTASLLIALLRASGIHARYNTGTIVLPIDKLMNWAGDFTVPQAALTFFASGGVPIKSVISGGKLTNAQLEHVWVEAFINYIPSRGAKHVNGKGDTWIKLDPSYKQYNYTNGIDIKSAVPFDAQSFLTQIQSAATINETQGYVTGVNSLLTQQTMQDYQARVQSYIQQNYPNATVGDVLGKKVIVKQEFPYLLGTLPYRTAVKGSTFTEIPDTLRHKLTFSVTKDEFDDTPISITKSLPELAGKKITLSYAPATSQDEAIINAYLPQPHADGTPIQPSELPSSLPAYLINVKPELRIDGQVVATGAPLTLGADETFNMTFIDPSAANSVVTNSITAGNFEAIGLNLGRISQDQLTNLKAKLEATKTKLQNNDFADLTKDDLVGDLLYTTALCYHAEVGTMNYFAAKTMGVNTITMPSETIFSTQLSVASMWGVPISVSASGLLMDAGRMLSVVNAKDGNSNTVRKYMLSSGMTTSALEHSVPEQLLSTPENKVEGISAVKALKIANDQNIPIYTVNQANIATTLPQLQVGQQVKSDIQNAVNAGKIVTVSKTNINFNGWNGCGYIIINPETGAGAYMISGGSNGGMILLFILWAVLFAIVALFGPMIGSILMIGAIGGVLITTFITTVVGVIGSAVINSAYNLPISINPKAILTNYSIQVALGALLVLNPVVGLVGFILVNLLACFFDMQLTFFVRYQIKRERKYASLRYCNMVS